MDWQRDLLGLLAGLVLATITTPAGVSGAVFLLPFQAITVHPESAHAPRGARVTR